MSHPAIAPGKVAVVTGAGMGIGRALARRFAAEGMRVALLDIDAERLHDARAEIDRETGGETTAILCDVAEVEALEVARDRIADTWGSTPAVLVNNAVSRLGHGMWAPLAEWRRALDINLMGVINGVRAFAPVMIESGRAGLIINLGSKQGITNPPGHPVYNIAKAAVKTYTEALAHELREIEGHQVSAHLLVPGWTTTGDAAPQPGAWLPGQVADFMMDRLAGGAFYIICPDNEVSEAQDRARIQWAAQDITEGRPALSRWHRDWRDEFTRRQPR